MVTSISPGKYRVRVSSSTGEYATQYWGGATTFGSAQFVAVTDGVNVEGLNVALLRRRQDLRRCHLGRDESADRRDRGLRR